MRKFIILPLLWLIGTFAVAQRNTCGADIFSFKGGEEVSYRIAYNWAFIWINAGDVVFSVRDTVYQSQPAYHLCAKGGSIKEFDWFFKVRDRFESIVMKDGFRPVWFERNTSEGGFNVFNRYTFNYADSTVSIATSTSKRPYKFEQKKLPPCTFDLLSAVYLCRNLNFNNRRLDEKIPITMVVDDEIIQLFIRYQGREELTSRDNVVYSTIKFSVLLVEGTMFNKGEDMTVWVTDDQNRIPVQVEAKILVGAVKAVLRSATGIRNPH